MSFQDSTSSLSSDRRKEYRLFISHSWEYSDEYERMVNLLEEYPRFNFRNYSVPEQDEIDADTEDELEEAVREQQIRPATVVIILGGMYVAYSKWIKKEVILAEIESKPILGVQPHGNEQMPNFVDDHADTVVGWDSNSVVEAIRNLAD